VYPYPITFHTIFIFDVTILWPRYSMNQGQPRSKNSVSISYPLWYFKHGELFTIVDTDDSDFQRPMKFKHNSTAYSTTNSDHRTCHRRRLHSKLMSPQTNTPQFHKRILELYPIHPAQKYALAKCCPNYGHNTKLGCDTTEIIITHVKISGFNKA